MSYRCSGSGNSGDGAKTPPGARKSTLGGVRGCVCEGGGGGVKEGMLILREQCLP